MSEIDNEGFFEQVKERRRSDYVVYDSKVETPDGVRVSGWVPPSSGITLWRGTTDRIPSGVVVTPGDKAYLAPGGMISNVQDRFGVEVGRFLSPRDSDGFAAVKYELPPPAEPENPIFREERGLDARIKDLVDFEVGRSPSLLQIVGRLFTRLF